jgi:hypothetical protein
VNIASQDASASQPQGSEAQQWTSDATVHAALAPGMTSIGNRAPSGKKLYAYESFGVSLELEPVGKASRGTVLSAPQSFIAVVQIRVAGATRLMVAPIRLTADNRHPFATEADALMAG